MARKTNRATWFLLASIAITVALYYVPYGRTVGYPLVLFSTIAHEMGHGVAAVLVGGEFATFRMWADASGVATTRFPDTALASAAVSAGGLVGPAVVAAALFALATSARGARVALGLLAVICLAACVFVVRNLFGLAFVGGSGAVLGVLAAKLPSDGARLAVMFLGVQLALTVFSRGDYLFTAVAHTSGGDAPSDVAQMAAALGGPFWLWGGLVGLLSLGILVIGLLTTLRAR